MERESKFYINYFRKKHGIEIDAKLVETCGKRAPAAEINHCTLFLNQHNLYGHSYL